MTDTSLESLSRAVWERLREADEALAIESPFEYVQRLATEIDPDWVTRPGLGKAMSSLQSAVAGLPPTQVRLLHLHVQQECSYVEIAHDMGLDVDCVLDALVDTYTALASICDQSASPSTRAVHADPR